MKTAWSKTAGSHNGPSTLDCHEYAHTAMQAVIMEQHYLHARSASPVSDVPLQPARPKVSGAIPNALNLVLDLP